MTYERWQDLIAKLKDHSQDAKLGKEDLPEGPGHCEFAEFTTPMGRMRLELIVRPVVLEKKMLYSHRMNTAATVKYTYDESEHTFTFKAYRFDEAVGDWVEVRPEAITASF